MTPMLIMAAAAATASGMDWSTFADTALGGALALSGGIAGAVVTDRRAAAREQRTRDHEREVWARGLRHEAHVAFLSIVDEKFKAVSSAREDDDGREAPDDFLVPVWDRYQALRMVCTKDTAEAAERVTTALLDYTFQAGQWQNVEHQRDVYLGAIRAEFHLPPIPD